MIPTQSLAADGRSLERLKAEAARDPQAAVKQAATQFEALFTQMMLKSMRDALPGDDLAGSDEGKTWTGMLDGQLAQGLAGRPGGLADMIAKQLGRNMPGGVAPAVDAGAADAALRKLEAAGAARTEIKAARATEPAATPRAAPDRAAFVNRLWEPALAAQKATGVPANFIVGQAALETGWGRGELKRADGTSAHNLFGVKAGANWKGDTVRAVTTEYVNGEAVKKVQTFRAYASHEEAFKDWAGLIGKSPRYAQVLKAGDSVEGFAQGLQRAGYATDPRYADKLAKTINQAIALRRLTV